MMKFTKLCLPREAPFLYDTHTLTVQNVEGMTVWQASSMMHNVYSVDEMDVICIVSTVGFF